jgi:RimJ/RimL family protein N-acetyltransferase
MFRRFLTEPFLIGLDWAGFRDAQEPARRFAADGYLGADDGRLMVEIEDDHVAAGLVSYRAGLYSGMAKYWEIGIALLPEWRGRGVGWRAQAVLCDYLFHHTPAHRIQAATHLENLAEEKSLEKAGCQLEGRIRAGEFRAGQWRDGRLYSRLRAAVEPVKTGEEQDHRSDRAAVIAPKFAARDAALLLDGVFLSRPSCMAAGICRSTCMSTLRLRARACAGAGGVRFGRGRSPIAVSTFQPRILRAE